MHTTTPLRTAAALSTAVLLSVTAAALAPPTAAAETIAETTGTISTEERDVEGTTIPAGAAVDWTTTIPGGAVEEGALTISHYLKASNNLEFCPSTDPAVSIVPLTFSIIDSTNGEELAGGYWAVRTFELLREVKFLTFYHLNRDADSVTFLVKATLCTTSGGADPAGTTYEYKSTTVSGDVDEETTGTVTVPGGDSDPDTPPVTPPTGSLGSLGSLTGSL